MRWTRKTTTTVAQSGKQHNFEPDCFRRGNFAAPLKLGILQCWVPVGEIRFRRGNFAAPLKLDLTHRIRKESGFPRDVSPRPH
jgi:hypothetical protein